VTPAGAVTTFAGGLPAAGGAPQCAPDDVLPIDGAGTAARFPGGAYRTNGLTIDAAGNLYTIHSRRVGTSVPLPLYIRKITPAGVVSTISVTGVTANSFTSTSIWVSADGATMYLSDRKNLSPSKIGRVAMSTGAFILTLTASNNDQYKSTCVMASSGTQYIANSLFQGNWITKLVGTTLQDVASTQAGAAAVGYADGVGNAARFGANLSLFCDNANNRLVVADPDNKVIRAVDTTTRAVSTLSGQAPTTGVAVDGTGAAARFASPSNIVADAAGNWYVTDTAAHAIRKVTATGVVTTFAGLLGTAGNAVGSGTTARFNAPVGMTIGSDGTLYVADRDRLSKITAAGVVSTLSTGGTALPSGQAVAHLAVDTSSQNLFFIGGDGLGAAQEATLCGNHIYRLGPGGGSPVVAYGGGIICGFLGQLAIDESARRLYFTVGGALRCRDISDPTVVPLPHCLGVGSLHDFGSPSVITGQAAVGPTGTLYILGYSTVVHKVLTVAPHTVSIVASAPGSSGIELGPLPARLYKPSGLWVNPSTGQLGIVSSEDGALLVTTGFQP
jgi:hypothetical protein